MRGEPVHLTVGDFESTYELQKEYILCVFLLDAFSFG